MSEQSEWMSPSDIEALTSLKQPSRQSEWLTDQGIPHKLIGRSIKLSRSHVRAWLEGARMNVGGNINFGAIA